MLVGFMALTVVPNGPFIPDKNEFRQMSAKRLFLVFIDVGTNSFVSVNLNNAILIAKG